MTVAALGATGCVASYSGKPPLSFEEYPYTSVEGEPWPVHEMELPEIQQLYGMATTPTVRYVELNPEGAQTIVFIHGLGSYLKFWRYQLNAFADQGYRVVAFDMLGYGKSDKPATFPYTMEAMGDVLVTALNKKDISQPILVGHSMGGQTALSLAIRYPRLARGLVVVSSAGFEYFSWRDEQWFRDAYTTRLVKAASEEDIWNSVRRNNFYRWRSEYNWLIEERVRVRETPEFDSYAYAQVRSVQALADNDFVRENLDKIVVPTMIIYGDMDRLIPNPFLHGGFTSDVMEYGARNIAQSTLVELENCGHTLQMDCHQAFNEATMSYIADTLGQGAERVELGRTQATDTRD